VKFTPAGGTAEVRVFAAGPSAVVEVADEGIGIAPADQARLFERFFRTRAAEERAIQGTGLGLSIAKAIVEAHKGTIAVRSELGAGTTFRVELPIRASIAERDAA
jgi:signal transduction histidine kinase